VDAMLFAIPTFPPPSLSGCLRPPPVVATTGRVLRSSSISECSCSCSVWRSSQLCGGSPNQSPIVNLAPCTIRDADPTPSTLFHPINTLLTTTAAAASLYQDRRRCRCHRPSSTCPPHLRLAHRSATAIAPKQPDCCPRAS
jgi:hypothetical protein